MKSRILVRMKNKSLGNKYLKTNSLRNLNIGRTRIMKWRRQVKNCLNVTRKWRRERMSNQNCITISTNQLFKSIFTKLKLPKSQLLTLRIVRKGWGIRMGRKNIERWKVMKLRKEWREISRKRRNWRKL
jgi:hypothetical protein